MLSLRTFVWDCDRLLSLWQNHELLQSYATSCDEVISQLFLFQGLLILIVHIQDFVYKVKWFVTIFSASPIVEYIDSQFEKYLQQELKIKRTLNVYHDTRVHVCLYFISPSGHS